MRTTYRIIYFTILILLSFQTFSNAVEIRGTINSNTVWTVANSPYIITGNILVRENVHLTIEPGVMVKFMAGPTSNVGYYIRIDGTLDAQGTDANPITFTADNPNQYWGCIAFNDTSNDWDALSASGSVLKNCIIEYAGNDQGGLNDFGSAAIRLFSAAPLLSDNVIRNCSGDGIRYTVYDDGSEDLEPFNGTINIQNNLIYNTTIGVNIDTASVNLENNYIVDNQQAIYIAANGSRILMKDNTLASKSSEFYGGCLRIDLFFQEDNPSVITVSNNNFIYDSLFGNAIAILRAAQGANYSLSITNNNFALEYAYAAVFLSGWQYGDTSQAINATNNYWGTTTSSEIESLLYEQSDDFNLPIINYEPIANERIANSGSNISYPLTSDTTENENIINEDTTWTLAESPYEITGNVIVKQGYTLTIEPGVRVVFQAGTNTASGYYLRVDGALDAQGTEENPITFTSVNPNLYWGCIGFTDDSMDWDATHSSGSVLKNCVLEYAGNDQGGLNDFGGAAIRIFSAAPLISDNIIRNSSGDGIRGTGGIFYIKNNLIYNTSNGVVIDTGNASIENNYFIDNQQAIAVLPNGFKIDIKNNTIKNKAATFYGGCLRLDLNYQIQTSEITIENNDFFHDNRSGNAVAIIATVEYPNYTLHCSNNNFDIGEMLTGIYLSGWEFSETLPNLDFTDNYWGTTDASIIESFLYDKQDDANLPEITYKPYAGEKIAASGSDLTYPLEEDGADNENIIRQDTTWSYTEEPHKITGNVIVKEGYTLTIEPGVVVEFQKGPNNQVGYYIRVDGTLNAQGTAEQPIRFTTSDNDFPWGCIAFSNTSRDWDENTSSGSILKYCILEHGGNTQGNLHEFGNALIRIDSASPLISHNIIRNSAVDGIQVFGGDQTILSNQIYNTTVGINLISAGGVIENNYLIYNQQGILYNANGYVIDIRSNTIISDHSPVFLGNLLRLSLYYSLNPSDINIANNVLLSQNTSGSSLAIVQVDGNVDSSILIKNNNLELNEAEWGVYLMGWENQNGLKTIDMTANWWGTVDTSEIDGFIYDSQDNFDLPQVIYTPLVTEEITAIGSNLQYPPIANAGQDQTVDEETVVTLDATGSYDPENHASYLWKKIDGPDITLMNADTATPTFVAPSGGETGTSVTLQVAMTIDSGFADYDEVVIIINPSPELETRSKGDCFITSTNPSINIWLVFVGLLWFWRLTLRLVRNG